MKFVTIWFLNVCKKNRDLCWISENSKNVWPRIRHHARHRRKSMLLVTPQFEQLNACLQIRSHMFRCALIQPSEHPTRSEKEEPWKCPRNFRSLKSPVNNLTILHRYIASRCIHFLEEWKRWKNWYISAYEVVLTSRSFQEHTGQTAERQPCFDGPIRLVSWCLTSKRRFAAWRH